MAQISDLIMKQVMAAAGNVEIPSNIKNSVLNGLSESVLGSLSQTAMKAGGVDAIKGLLTGKVAAAQSPVTALAGNLFKNNVVKSLGLDNVLAGKLSGIIPMVIGGLGGILKDQDGDGDVDLNDILITLQGGQKQAAGAGILGAAAKGILGGMLKKL